MLSLNYNISTPVEKELNNLDIFKLFQKQINLTDY